MMRTTMFGSRLVMASCLSMAIMVSINLAQAELSIRENAPDSSIVNRYEQLQDKPFSSPELHQFVQDLNARVAAQPNDDLAWGLLAKIYDQHGYSTYATYAANEAMANGYSSDELEQIILNNSLLVAQNQLDSNYLVGINDPEFLTEYQRALSEIYGEVYALNFDESKPKPPRPVVKAVSKRVSAPVASSVRAKRTSTAAKPKPKPKPKVVAKPKPKPVVKKPTTPKQTTQPTSTTKPNDPFSILR